MSSTIKTTENVANRRRADDWKARQPWTDQEHDEVTTKADNLYCKAWNLAQVVKLAAFAAEARRTLTDIEDELEHRPKVRDDLRNHVFQMTAWVGMPDPTGDALTYVADEMEAVAKNLCSLTYSLASRLKAGERQEAAA